ncbi:MAG TPA: TonB-dependent receptor, partial [Chryseosolibacter sp.]|nr:TonB-dependent receptor [Chryseosolibacter sp.]
HGGFSAEYGGRLSSIVDVSTLSGIAEKTTASANIGLISSSFKLEQPISKDKLGFWIAGRTSYVDKVSQLSSASNFPYSFQELNGKVIFSPSKSDKMELSHYSAIDYLDIMRDVDGDGRGMKTTYHSNNSLETFKWRHSIGRRWNSEASAFHTRFAYNTANAFKEEYAVSGQSDIQDIGARLSLHRDSLWTGIALSAGIEWMRHDISPKIINPHGSVSDLVEAAPPDDKIVHELAAYVQQEWSILPRLTISAGLRTSMAITPTKKYIFPEPRLSLRFALPKEQVLKLSYSRMVQYLHRISNSAMSTPIDVWLPVSDTFGPQTSRQISMAWQRFSSGRKIFFSAEGFYKSMDDLLAYKLGTNFLFKSDFNSMLVKGDGKAYGLEFLVRKESGSFTGWISYTLSWSWRRYDDMNDGKWFHARYDRRHNGAVVGQYRLGKRWMASMIWEYISGARFTPAVGQYLATAPGGDGLVLVPEYAPLNSVKLSDAHRLDLSFRYFSRPGSKFKWSLFGGVYNAYNRATPFGIVIRDDPDQNTTRYVQPALFGLIPFVGYGCQF